MAELNFLKSYPEHVANCLSELPAERAFATAVGGDFTTVGKLERALLSSLGLLHSHLVVDVGCGSGRLAAQLSSMWGLRYLGTDVVPALLDYARQVCRRHDWDFICTRGMSIPCDDRSADFVCFFSVFTHLTHEDTFRYLKEAKRVLAPEGKIVFSFLEFCIPCHWTVFQQMIENAAPGSHLNQFLDRDAIKVWAEHLGLRVELIADGDKPHFAIEEEIAWDSGVVMSGLGNLGQSVAVLTHAEGTADAATIARAQDDP